jgi:polyisoprenoid-binding protein YceI
MKKIKLTLFLLSLFVYSSIVFSQEDNSAQWEADVTHSNLGFKVKHKGISNTVGDFRDFDLHVTSSTDNFEKAEISLNIKAKSINTANESRDEHLRSSEFFDAGKYPEISFKSKKVTKQKESDYLVFGDLTMHGVTKEIVLTMTHNGTAKARDGRELAGLYFSTTFNRLDFQIGAGLPTEMVADQIELHAEIEIIKK